LSQKCDWSICAFIVAGRYRNIASFESIILFKIRAAGSCLVWCWRAAL
jgi:hypothetical protein